MKCDGTGKPEPATPAVGEDESLLEMWERYRLDSPHRRTDTGDALASCLRALLADVARLTARRFPIMHAAAIPWDMIAPHEAQAVANHGQTLEQLARRGGLAPYEALLVLDSLKLTTKTITRFDNEVAELARRVDEYHRKTNHAACDAEIKRLRELALRVLEKYKVAETSLMYEHSVNFDHDKEEIRVEVETLKKEVGE